jgi:hypothetical protein
MAGLSAPLLPRDRSRRSSFDRGRVGRGGLGGVGGVLVDPLLQLGDAPLQGREQRPDGGLGLGGNGVPERLRDRGRIAHAAWYTGWRSLKQYSTIERLPTESRAVRPCGHRGLRVSTATIPIHDPMAAEIRSVADQAFRRLNDPRTSVNDIDARTLGNLPQILDNARRSVDNARRRLPSSERQALRSDCVIAAPGHNAPAR